MEKGETDYAFSMSGTAQVFMCVIYFDLFDSEKTHIRFRSIANNFTEIISSHTQHAHAHTHTHSDTLLIDAHANIFRLEMFVSAQKRINIVNIKM